MQISELPDEGSRKLTNSIFGLVFFGSREEAECKGLRRASAYYHRRVFDAKVLEGYMTAGISFQESLADEMYAMASVEDWSMVSEWVAQCGRKGGFGEVLESAAGLLTI